MVYIYCLASEDTIWYVGQTKCVAKRKHAHKRKYAKGYASDTIPDDVKWDLIVLEKVSDDQAYNAERFYYDFLHPVSNKQIPGRPRPEGKKAWEERNREKRREYQRRSYVKVKAKRALLASLKADQEFHS